MAKVAEVTPESIQRVARRLYHPDLGRRPTVLTMGHDQPGELSEVFQRYGVGSVDLD